MSEIKDISDILSAAKNGAGLVTQIDGVLNVFRPFKPEVRRFRINYLDKTSEIKYLLKLPSGRRRTTHRKVELPATYGFKIDEILDLDTTHLVNVNYDSVGDKWVFDAKKFPDSERFMVTLKGNVTADFLNSLVSVKCAANPTKKGDSDCYWVHSALKDVSILEKIWDELDIERVNADVRIGVERYFNSAIPYEIKERIGIQKALLDAIAQGQRNLTKLQSRYRQSVRKTSVSPSDLLDLMKRLVSGDFFSSYVTLDNPFVLGLIKPERQLTSIIPEKVQVNILTDLTFKLPAAKGALTFKKSEYVDDISKAIENFVPKKSSK